MIEERIDIDGVTVSIARGGNASASDLVLFIHGMCSSKEFFEPLLHSELFGSAALLAVDLAGFGASAKPEDFSYQMEDQAAICAKLLAGERYERVHLVCHSMGGAVGLLLAPALGARLQSFANLEGNLIGADCGLLSGRIAAVSLEEYERRIFAKHRAAFALVPGLRFDLTTPLAAHRSSRSLVRWSESGELLDRFRRLACRKVYVYGEENSGLEVLPLLEGIETIMIPRAGHGMVRDNPGECARKLARFMLI